MNQMYLTLPPRCVCAALQLQSVQHRNMGNTPRRRHAATLSVMSSNKSFHHAAQYTHAADNSDVAAPVSACQHCPATLPAKHPKSVAGQAMEMVADVGAPNVVVHLDSYHMNIEEDSMAKAVDACGDKLGCCPAEQAQHMLPATCQMQPGHGAIRLLS